MAQIIDAAALAEMAMNKENIQVTILPSERECDYDGMPMSLITKSDGILLLRIHTCKECGFEKRYGGSIPETCECTDTYICEDHGGPEISN